MDRSRALRRVGGGGWLLTLREWDEYEHVDPEDGPPVLDADVGLEHQLQSLADAGACEILPLRRGFRVRTRSHVGRIRVGRLTLVIEPKIQGAPMVELLRYAFGLRDVHIYDDVVHGTSRVGFQDLIAAALGAEIAELLARGLARRYVARSEELEAPRGRIEFDRLARSERVRASLPCRHHLRLLDTPLNRALAMGLTLARSVALDPALRAKLHGLELGFEGVRRPPLGRAALERARRHLDRTSMAYAQPLALTALLLDGMGISLDSNPAVRIEGFLFDLNVFFQSLLGRFLREHLEQAEVLEERPLRGMLRWDPLRNPRNRIDPCPRPDYAVRRTRGGPVELLDAKYQDLSAYPPSRDVVYQLAMYALSKDGGGRATILYPGERGAADQALLIYGPSSGDFHAEVIVRAVDLLHLHELLARRGARDRRVEYARELAFGKAS